MRIVIGDWDYLQSQSLIAKLELSVKLVLQKVLEKFKELTIIEITKNRPYLERETEKIK